MKKYKEEYDKQVENSATQINYNEKMRKHTKKTPPKGFIAQAVRILTSIFWIWRERVNLMGAGSRGWVWWEREQRNGRQDSTVPIRNVNAQEGQSSSSSVPILPADSCPEGSELKKDASFLDDLGKWLLIHFIQNRFIFYHL